MKMENFSNCTRGKRKNDELTIKSIAPIFFPIFSPNVRKLVKSVSSTYSKVYSPNAQITSSSFLEKKSGTTIKFSIYTNLARNNGLSDSLSLPLFHTSHDDHGLFHSLSNLDSILSFHSLVKLYHELSSFLTNFPFPFLFTLSLSLFFTDFGNALE